MADTESPWLDGMTIGAVLDETARRFPERDALIFPESNTRMNYAEFHAAVRDVAKGLLAMGIRPGEHIGIWATNIPQWMLLQYAAASAGIVLVTINPAYRPFELSYTVTQSDIETERLLEESSLQFTVLRHPLYVETMKAFLGPNVLETGVRVPSGAGRIPLTRRQDLAEGAAALLAQDSSLPTEI